MKIAVISDIHGNMEALQSVLHDIEKEKCDKIFCLGDIAMAGPEPKSTIKKVNDLMQSKDFYIVQGNTDKMLSVFSFNTHKEILATNEVMANAYLADSELLDEEEKSFLKDLPVQQEIELFGTKILLVHGSPRKNNENIFPNMKIEEIEEMLQGVSADIIFCGHTHMPCGYQTNTKQTVVNAGSVGRPFSKEPKSCYVVMEINEKDGSFNLKHKFISYDVKTASNKIKQRGFEGAEKLAKMLLHTTSRYPE